MHLLPPLQLSLLLLQLFPEPTPPDVACLFPAVASVVAMAVSG